MKIKTSHKSAFTLVELSIVLVIIGLVVGGIFVGNDLINAAKIRSQITQLEKLEVAMNAFKLKYNCIPGDCADAQNFFGTTFNGATINPGNGDGKILSTAAGYNGTDCLSGKATGSETDQVFIHLNASGLGNYEFSDANGNIPNKTWVGMYLLPHDVYGGGMMVTCLDPVHPITAAGYNFLPSFSSGTGIIIGGVPNGGGNVNYNGRIYGIAGVYVNDSNNPLHIPPSIAQAIDIKIDDGIPSTGRVGVGFACYALQPDTLWSAISQGYPWVNSYAPLVAATPPCNVSMVKVIWN